MMESSSLAMTSTGQATAQLGDAAGGGDDVVGGQGIYLLHIFSEFN